MTQLDKWQEFKDHLLKALSKLFEKDRDLLEREVNERTLSFKLGEYLSSQYPNYHVDCEYNRKGDEVKRLPRSQPSQTSDTRGQTIFPDIIIHERGNDERNLAILEIKKYGNNDIQRDIDKLQSLTNPQHDYKYDFGIHLTFDKKKVCDAQVYIGGSKSEGKTSELKTHILKASS
jgi:hypothetical protein